MTDTCRACGAPLAWVRMEATGKAMPCDPEILRVWLIADVDAEPAGVAGQPVVTLVTEDGLTARGIVAPTALTPFAAQWSGMVPHWVTCPDGARFRQP
jgi:hypothetical protein